MDCARNIITANFSGGGTSATTAPLWQWDYGQVLCITGIDLPAAFEVHFSTNRTGGVSTVAVGADGQVTIPNELLTIGKNLNAWIYLSDSEGEGETEYSILIPVKARPMPETYDAEVSGEFDDVVRRVSEYAETAQTAADNAGASATAAAASASEAAASASAAETAKTAAETAQGKAEDAHTAAESAAQTATQKAQQTAQDAAQAAQSKADAESAAQSAEAAQTGAESAKTDAETAAQGAAASASAASASAASAAQAATSAGQSATAAAGSATTAQGAAQTATTKAGEASASATAAAASETAAQTAQTAAETAAGTATASAATAATKAGEAAQSATSAAQSKTDAEAAATRAETAAASLTVDSALSDTSVNPVQNKVITESVIQVKNAIDALKITDTASGAIASFPDGAAMPMEGLTVELSPIQEGSGDPSPDNIRPITVRDSVTVTRTGKNLIPPTIVRGLLYNKSSGTFTMEPTDRAWTQADEKLTYTTSANYTNLSISTGLLPAGQYHVKLTKLSSGSLRATRYILDSAGNILARGADSNITSIDVTATLTEPGYYAIFLDNGSTANQTVEMTVQIEVGSTATAYEPYDAQSVTVQLGQTVYGGTAEIISGQGESTMALIDMGSINWGYYASGDYFYAILYDRFLNTESDIGIGLCSCYKYFGNYANLQLQNQMPDFNFGFTNSSNSKYVYIKDSRFTDAESFKTAVTGQKLAYTLQASAHTAFATDPATLSTLKGQNNVWSDADSVEVDYVADPKLYIDKKITAAVAALA